MSHVAQLGHRYTAKRNKKDTTVIPVSCAFGRHGKQDSYTCLVEDTGESFEISARGLTLCTDADVPKLFFFSVTLPGERVIYVRAPRQFQAEHYMNSLIELANIRGLNVYPVYVWGIVQIDACDDGMLTIDLAFKHRVFSGAD